MLFQHDYKRIEPASGALVMACGIFLIGAIEAFPLLHVHLGKWLAFVLLLVWVFIYKRLSVQFFQREFLVPFLMHPVNSFAIGTWIAGVSVLCNVFLAYFPAILIITQAMAVFNTFLFLFFVVNIVHNFKRLLWDDQHYPVHGIVLISTVGTQSIIVLLHNVFPTLPTSISVVIIVLGICFYLIGIFLIIRRYVRQKHWTLVDDWTNTNCIIHGALSITGLAIVSSNTFSVLFVVCLWWLIVGLLIVVEALEIVRACLRVKLYGFKKGIYNYHISQWSRNFTFGMFYTFTLYMHRNPFYPIPEKLQHFQEVFIGYWAWLVLLALVIQISVYLTDKIPGMKQ